MRVILGHVKYQSLNQVLNRGEGGELVEIHLTCVIVFGGTVSVHLYFFVLFYYGVLQFCFTIAVGRGKGLQRAIVFHGAIIIVFRVVIRYEYDLGTRGLLVRGRGVLLFQDVAVGYL